MSNSVETAPRSIREAALEALRAVQEGSNQSWIRSGSREAIAVVEGAASDADAASTASKALVDLSNATGDRWVKRLAGEFLRLAAAAAAGPQGTPGDADH